MVYNQLPEKGVKWLENLYSNKSFEFNNFIACVKAYVSESRTEIAFDTT